MARGKGQKAQSITKQVDFSLIHWAGIAMVIGFLFYFPFRQALYNGDTVPFEGNILQSDIYLLSLLLLSAAHLFFKWKWNDWRARLSIAVWSIPLIYWVSSLHAVSLHDAQFMTLIYCTLSVLFISGMYLLETKISRVWIEYVLIVSGYLIVIFGFLNAFGQASYAGAIWVQSYGNRLGSVFQYPNTYAAYLSALLLACIYVIISVKALLWKFLNALMLVPILLSLMLTLSRGALALLPALVFLVLVFLKPTRQILFLVNAVIAGALTLAVLAPVSSIADRTMRATLPDYNGGKYILHSVWDKLPLSGWLWLVAGALVASLLIVAVHRWLEPRVENRLQHLNERRAAPFLLPLALIAVAILAAIIAVSSPWVRSQLPQSIGERLENLNLRQHSVLERETFYRDALTLSSDYPILGAGGGAWSSLYQKYQNNPYVSKQTHSFFFQTLVEVGWLGLLVIICFFGWIFFLYVRSHIRHADSRGSHLIFYIFAVSILVHSFIDFDMSFIYLASIFFFSLGGMLAGYRKVLAIGNKNEENKWRYVYPGAAIILSLGLLFWTFRLYGAHSNYNYAMGLAAQGEQELSKLTPAIDAAIRTDPANPIYTLTKIDWLHQVYIKSGNDQYLQEREQLITQLKQYEHVNRDLYLDQYRYYKDMQNNDLALQTLQKGIEDFKWDINFYEAAIFEYYQAGEQDKNDLAKRDQDWEKALGLFEEVMRRQDLLKDLPEEQLQGRDFSVSVGIRQTIGQIYFYQAKYEEAVSVLEPATKGDQKEQEVRISSRYYLASLQMIGENDESLQKKLFDADSNEREALHELVESRKS